MSGEPCRGGQTLVVIISSICFMFYLNNWTIFLPAITNRIGFVLHLNKMSWEIVELSNLKCWDQSDLAFAKENCNLLLLKNSLNYRVSKKRVCLMGHKRHQKWTKDKSRVNFGNFRKFPFQWAQKLPIFVKKWLRKTRSNMASWLPLNENIALPEVMLQIHPLPITLLDFDYRWENMINHAIL